MVKLPNDWMPRISLPVSLLYICWLFAQCVIYMVPFGGEEVKGLPLPGGPRLTYRLNGNFIYEHILQEAFGELCRL